MFEACSYSVIANARKCNCANPKTPWCESSVRQEVWDRAAKEIRASANKDTAADAGQDALEELSGSSHVSDCGLELGSWQRIGPKGFGAQKSLDKVYSKVKGFMLQLKYGTSVEAKPVDAAMRMFVV